MLNRQARRAFDRSQHQTHKLVPHQCVLWIPAARAFLGGFTEDGFTVVQHVDDAYRFCEHIVSNVALTIRERFALRVVVRPYHGQLQDIDHGQACHA